MRQRGRCGASRITARGCWLPLYVHLADAAGVVSRLWDCWLPKATREVVARAVGGEDGGVCFVKRI
ncbi:HD domain-containing protein [Parafannyhessea umbonata]|uniref:HD domain-containing protein n=1 Tax=Parafannyhessea umbonata TaxID=604330 RepID=UPI0034C65D76